MEPPLRRSLEQAIRELYRVFGVYRRPPHVQGCPHCIRPEDEQRLHSAPLPELRGEDLRRYAFKALTTWGTVDDLRHYLPRMLELLAREPAWGIDPEVVLGKLALAGWRGWPSDEQTAVEAYLGGLWCEVLGRYPQEIELDGILCGIGRAEEDVGRYLADWEQECSDSAVRQLAAYAVDNAPMLRRKHALRNSFWRERPAQMAQVVDWVLSPARVALLEQTFFAREDEAWAEDLARAVDALAALQFLDGREPNVPG